MLRLRALLLTALLALAGLLAACGTPSPQPALPPAPEREAEWQAWRAQKDSLFRTAASPLPEPLREDFGGLAYFPYDSALALPVALEPTLEADTILMSTTVGPPRPYVRFGTFSFPLGGQPRRLAVFTSADPAEGELFVPFTDATNRSATYGGGRYLHFEPTAEGRYVLDFNYAYNPYCTYDVRYSCPLPPEENRLGASIAAGERRFETE